MDAIDRGIAFLAGRQLAYGEFQTFAGSGRVMRVQYAYSSPFITTFILYALRGITHPELEFMREKAVRFLLHEQEPGGIWRNHTRANTLHQQYRLPPDLDDISTVSYTLQSNGVPFDDNHSLIRHNRNDQGLFQTWIDPPFANEIDAVVNANVLLYLGENIPAVCAYINQVIRNNEPFSKWYPDKLAFYYMVSRAFANGIAGLGQSKEPVVDDIRRCQLPDGSFGNDLQTAMALTTLLNFVHVDEMVQAGIAHLLNRQDTNGSWSIAPFFNGFKMFYGSAELTAAIAVEALKKYASYGMRRR